MDKLLQSIKSVDGDDPQVILSRQFLPLWCCYVRDEHTLPFKCVVRKFAIAHLTFQVCCAQGRHRC